METIEKMNTAIEILNEKFAFLGDFRVRIENKKTINGGFGWMKMATGFGYDIDSPLFEIFIGINEDTTIEEIIKRCSKQVANHLETLKSADEDRAEEFGEPLKYRYNYDELIEELRK
jgi:hypothetical protein